MIAPRVTLYRKAYLLSFKETTVMFYLEVLVIHYFADTYNLAILY